MIHNGIEIAWGGYNDAMSSFVKGTLEKIVELQSHVTERSFAQAREKLLQSSENFYLGNTY